MTAPTGRKGNDNMNTTIIIHNKATMKATGIHTHKNAKPVICLDNGNRYASVTDAAEAVGVTHNSLSAHLNGDTKTCGGMHWSFMSRVTESADTILDHASHLSSELDKANKKLAEQEAEMAEFRAWKAEKERIRKAEEARQHAIAKAKEKVERRKRMAIRKEEEAAHAWNRVHEAEKELAELIDEKEE